MSRTGFRICYSSLSQHRLAPEGTVTMDGYQKVTMDGYQKVTMDGYQKVTMDG